MFRLDHRRTAALVFAFSAGACGPRSSAVIVPTAAALHSSPRLVTHEGLASLGRMPLDDALRRIRPELLRYRNTSVAIYIDRRPASGAELHELTADMVARVQLLSPVESALEYGPLYGGGAILDVRIRRVR